MQCAPRFPSTTHILQERERGSFGATQEAGRDRARGSLCRPPNLENENGNQAGDPGPRSPLGLQNSGDVENGPRLSQRTQGPKESQREPFLSLSGAEQDQDEQLLLDTQPSGFQTSQESRLLGFSARPTVPEACRPLNMEDINYLAPTSWERPYQSPWAAEPAAPGREKGAHLQMQSLFRSPSGPITPVPGHG